MSNIVDSNKKFLDVLSTILVIQMILFFIGVYIAPTPSSTEQLLATKCIADDTEKFSIPRAVFSPYKSVKENCRIIAEEDNASHGHIVFAFQLPLPRDGIQLDYSRWQQNLLTKLIPNVTYSPELVEDHLFTDSSHDELINTTIKMNIRLGVRNIGDKNWKDYAKKNGLKRTISCKIDVKKRTKGYKYDCDVVRLFELQSLYYDYYLINLDFVDQGMDRFVFIQNLQLVASHQNARFTKILVLLKTTFTFMTLFTLIWFSKRVNQLHRETTLLEKTLIVLGCALSQLNFPIEFLSLWFDLEFMSIICVLRQMVFQCALFAFWIIFMGEHLLDGIHRSRLSSYYKQLSIVLIVVPLDLIKKGIQWFDPFFANGEPHRFTFIFRITAAISSLGFVLFMCYHIWLAYRNIWTMESSLPSMSSTRRLLYQGIIDRVKFVRWTTSICAYAFLFAFIKGQASTVFAVCNFYVITLLILYAPSRKSRYGILIPIDANNDNHIEVGTN